MDENPYQAPAGEAMPPPLPAALSSPWNGWWTLLWAFVIFIVWQVVVTVVVLVAGFQRGAFSNPGTMEKRVADLALDGDVAGVAAFLAIFVVCPLCWFLGRVRPGFSGWSYLGNDRVKWWHWPVWGAATIACSVIFGMLAPYLGVKEKDDSMVAMAASTDIPLLLYLGVGIGAPLVEEFIFRGMLWRGWRASRLGLPGTLILTSFLWALPHVQYPVVTICYIFVLGLVLGLAREKTGSIWVPVWMHALNNGIATIQMLMM